MTRALLISLSLSALMGCGDDTTTEDHDDSGHTAHDADPDTDTDTDTATDTDTGPDGESLYGTHCEACHAADGTGSGVGPDITHELHHSDEQLIQVILEGDGDMDPVAVSADEAQLIVDFMRSSWGN